MPKFLRTLTIAGLVCVVAALAGGPIKLAGSELPLITSLVRQWLLGGFGIGLFVVAFALWPRRSPMVTFVVQHPTTSLSRAENTVSGARVHTRRYGGGTLRVLAANFERSRDGKMYVFTDAKGQTVRELPSYQVKSIHRAPAGE